MSLPGLPPLPKSLSGLELAHQNSSSNLFAIESQRAIPTVTATRKPSTLDTQLAILRREMVSEYYIIYYIKHLGLFLRYTNYVEKTYQVIAVNFSSNKIILKLGKYP